MEQQEKKAPNLRFKGFTNDWEQRKLGEVAEKVYSGLSGKTKSDFGHGEAAYVTYINVHDNVIAKAKEIEKVEVDSKQNQVQKGDIFFTISSEVPEEVALNSVWPYETNTRLYLNSFCFGYRSNFKLINPFFLSYYLRSPHLRQIIFPLAQGISRFNISKKSILQLPIKLPKLQEQKDIYRILQGLENLLSLQQRKLDLLKQLKKGFLQKMFADQDRKQPVLRFKGFSGDWEQRKLKNSKTVFTDGNYSSSYPKSEDFTNSSEGIPFLKGSDIINGSLSKKNCKFITFEKNSTLLSGQILPDDVVIAVRGSLGNVGYATKKNVGWNINSQLAIIRTNKSELKGYFIYSFFLTNVGIGYIRSRITGTALKQLPIKQLTSIFVPITNINEQVKLGKLLNKVDKLIFLQQKEIDNLTAFKKFLLQQMFI